MDLLGRAATYTHDRHHPVTLPGRACTSECASAEPAARVSTFSNSSSRRCLLYLLLIHRLIILDANLLASCSLSSPSPLSSILFLVILP